MRQIYTLTGLRGYAALWVVALHYTWDWQSTGFPMAIARMGGAGLTTFFVLSGFILSHVYVDQLRDGLTRQAYWKFLWARFARVYPLHPLTLIVYAGIMGVGIIGSQGNEYFSTFLLNVLLLHAWGFTNELSWNQPSWSISTGFFAYLLFSFVIAMAMRGGWTIRIALFLATCAAILYAPYTAALFAVARHFGWDTAHIRFSYGNSVVYRFFVFSLGASLQPFAAFLLTKLRKPWFWDALFAAGVTIFLAICTDPARGGLMVWAATLVTFGLYADQGVGRLLAGNRIAASGAT